MNRGMMMLFAAGMVAGGVVSAAEAPAVVPAKAVAKPVVKAAEPVDVFAGVPDVVAEVGGKKIMKADVVKFLMSQMPDGKLPPMLNAETIKMIMPGVVKSFVDKPLLTDAAAKAGFKPSADLVKSEFQKQLKDAPSEQLEMVKQQLAMTGKTLESYIDEVAKNPDAQQQAALEAFLQKEILSKINVSDSDAKDFYDKNPDQFKTPADKPDMIRASHILIMAKSDAKPEEKAKALKKAKALTARLMAKPADFEVIAKDESECPSGKQAGGSLGAFGKGQMVPEFEKAAMALKPGEMTKEPVQTQFGYHIIRRDAAQTEKMESFDKVKAPIMEFIKSRKAQDDMAKYIMDLEAKNQVKFFMEMPKAN